MIKDQLEAIVFIEVEAYAAANERLFLAGNLPALGQWRLSDALPMYKVNEKSTRWRLKDSLHLPHKTRMEFKFFRQFDNYMEWEKLPGNRKFKVSAQETHLQMEWSDPKGREYRSKASTNISSTDSLDNFTQNLSCKLKDYVKQDLFHEYFDSDSELSSDQEPQRKSSYKIKSRQKKLTADTREDLLKLYGKIYDQSIHSRKHSFIYDEKIELALLTDIVPDPNSSLIKKIYSYTKNQNLTYWIRDKPIPLKGELQVRFVPEDYLLRLDFSTVYFYDQQLISIAFFQRLEKGRVTAVAFMPDSDFQSELSKRGYEVIWEKHPREDSLVICQLDFINRKTIKVYESPVDLKRFHPNKLKPSDPLNNFTDRNRNRILILDYDIFVEMEENQSRLIQDLARQKYTWIIMLSDLTPQKISNQPWLDDVMLISVPLAQFKSYGEWTFIKDKEFSPRLFLRTAVQMRSYQKGPIDYMFICLPAGKEWAFEEMLDLRRFSKNYFKRTSPLVVTFGKPTETSLAHFYLDSKEALLVLIERLNHKARTFR